MIHFVDYYMNDMGFFIAVNVLFIALAIIWIEEIRKS